MEMSGRLHLPAALPSARQRLGHQGSNKNLPVSMPRRRREIEVYLHSFLTSALDGDEWSNSDPGRFTDQERTQGFGAEKIACKSRNSNWDSLVVYPAA
jgi:hypothetical protein